MRNKSALINILSALLLAAVIGLTIYWTARPMRGQAAANRRTANKPMTPARQSALASRSFAAPMLDSAKRLAAPEALQGMPLAFIENRGQADARAAFLVQGRDTTAYFTAQGLTLALTQAAGSKGGARQRWNLKLDFVGANVAALPLGKELTRAQVSYFNGAPEQWRTGIKSYAQIVYPNLWPGIDLVYSGTTERLKYEFIVKPGADPQQIKLAYRGTNAPLAVNPQGQLEIPTPFGVIHDDKPISAQGKRKGIATEFVIAERAADGVQQYGFKVGKYDKRKTLVIDPAILVYSGFIGGSSDDEGHSIAVDGNGYAYVTGVTTSAQATFPEVAGPDLSYNGRTDAFVAKLKTDGSGLVYAGYIGGDGDEAGHSIAVDASGNAYVTGWTTSTQATFPVLGTLDPTFNGAMDAFVAKINPAGTALVYCGYLGGDDEDEGLGIAVDTTGRAYVTGLTASTEATFPKLIGPGLLFKGAIDAFVARVKADGSGLDYAGYLGGSGDDQGRSIAVDTNNNAYVAGLTTSTESSFPMVGALDPTFNGGTDAFVAKLNSTGSAVTYSGFIGGSGIDEAYGIAVDSTGNAYVTGRTNSTEATFPETVGPDLTYNGGFDAFVAKINAAGSALNYAGYIGGSGDDEGFGIAVNSTGNAIVTGRTASSEATFPKANAFDLTLGGTADGFIAKVNPAGSALNFAGYLGGNGLEEGFGVAVIGLRQAFVAGRSTDASFPTLLGPGLTFGGLSDAFVMRIEDNSVGCPTITITPATLPNGTAGVAYSQQLTANGGAGGYVFSLPSGTLPTGLTLSAIGLLAGTTAAFGPFNFTVRAKDVDNCMVDQPYTLTINAPCVPNAITVNPVTLANGFVGAGYSQTLTASGGTAPYTFTVSAGALPAGVTLNGSTGALTGTPTTSGTANFTIKAMDANTCMGTRAYTVIVSGNGLQFYALPQPVRLLETRAGLAGCTMPGAPINANGTLTLPARTTCAGIPTNAAAVTGNITVVPSGPGFLTLFPSSATQPTVANSNFQANEITNNVFTVGLGAGDGAFKIFSSATTHVIVDVTGYYAPPGTGGLYFHTLATPVRLLESRAGLTGCIVPGTPLTGTGDPNANPNLDLLLQGRSPVAAPCNSIPATAQVLVGNATSVLPTGGGYLTIYPSGGTRPTVASSNYAGNDVINGSFAVKLGADGKFKIYTFATTHLVVDILGYYSEDAVDANGAGLLFNPLPSPVRLLETRPGFAGCTMTGAPIVGNLNAATHTQMAANFCGLPAAAQAVVGNVSVVNTTGAGFLTLFPANLTTAPLVATSNYPAPATFGYNRHFFVGLSPADGKFKVLTQFTTDLILDASGYFAP